jgi:hypothetical protein
MPTSWVGRLTQHYRSPSTRAYMSTEQVTDMAKQWRIKPIVPVDDSD